MNRWLENNGKLTWRSKNDSPSHSELIKIGKNTNLSHPESIKKSKHAHLSHPEFTEEAKCVTLSHPEFIEGSKGVCVVVLLFLSQLGLAQSASSLFVGLKNGKVIDANSLDYVSKTFGSDYLVVDDSLSYPLKEVRYYQDETGYYLWTRVIGSFNDIKLRRELNGKIKTYTGIQTTYSPGTWTNGIYLGGGPSTRTLQYFQKGNGSVKKVSYDNLQYDLRDSPLSMEKLAEARKMKNGAIATYVISGAVMLGGLIHTASLNEQEGPPPHEATPKISPALIIGGLGLLIPSLTKSSREEKLIKAIKIYNQN